MGQPRVTRSVADESGKNLGVGWAYREAPPTPGREHAKLWGGNPPPCVRGLVIRLLGTGVRTPADVHYGRRSSENRGAPHNFACSQEALAGVRS